MSGLFEDIDNHAFIRWGIPDIENEYNELSADSSSLYFTRVDAATGQVTIIWEK